MQAAQPRLPPSNFNPLDPAKAYTGTQGLLYEPLFLYDPVHGKFIPWLATSGNWVNATILQVAGAQRRELGEQPGRVGQRHAHGRRCRVLSQPGGTRQGRPLLTPT